MLDALGELIGSLLSEVVGDLVFKPVIGFLERSRCFVIFVLLAAAGLCLLSTTFGTGSILGFVPLALGGLALVVIYFVAQRVVANLPDPPAPPAPIVVAPPLEPEAAAAAANAEANVDLDAAPAMTTEAPRSRPWFHLLCALAGAAGQLFGYLLLFLPSNGSQDNLAVQFVCSFPAGLAAGLLLSFILAPPAEIQKMDWREHLPRWAVGPVVSFIVGVVIFLPVLIAVAILSAA